LKAVADATALQRTLYFVNSFAIVSAVHSVMAAMVSEGLAVP